MDSIACNKKMWPYPMRWWQSRLSLDLATSERQDKNMQELVPLSIDCVIAAPSPCNTRGTALCWYPGIDLSGWRRREGRSSTASQNFYKTGPGPSQTVLSKESPQLNRKIIFQTSVCGFHVGVSKNNGTPKSSILIGFSIIFTIHFGVPLFVETPMFFQGVLFYWKTTSFHPLHGVSPRSWVSTTIQGGPWTDPYK